MIDKKDTVQVIYFMLKNNSETILSGKLLFCTVFTLILDGYLPVSLNFGGEFWDTQAPFLIDLRFQTINNGGG